MTHPHSLPDSLLTRVENAPGSLLLTDPARTRFFHFPQHILAPHHASELPAFFRAVEEETARGRFVAGFFSYECGQALGPKPASAPSPTPLAWFGVYERCEFFEPLEPLPAQEAISLDAPQLSLDEAAYAERIDAIHEWIRRGDVYQLNFTLPLRFAAQAAPSALFAHGLRRQPANYAAFLHWSESKYALSFSPELFFRIDAQADARRMTTRPMKGTAPRGRTLDEDRAQAEWLRSDEKNRAENLMIVDLLRNDLGRLCEYGSVVVDELFAVEKLPTLWQMTSTIRGDLRANAGLEEILRALFPCGSITGAPKIRAMQLIAELESAPRGVYCGSIGFFSGEESVFNVAIRTLELDHGQGRMGVGSGVVMDSEAHREYRECMMKAGFFFSNNERFSPPAADFQLVETLLYNQGFPLLSAHLERLSRSAEYFNFACDTKAARQILLTASENFPANAPMKVRLLLNASSALHIEHEPLPANVLQPEQARLRVCFSAERTDARNPMLFHKTTHRPLYQREWTAAKARGFDDVLFLNQREEVTESAIANIFVRIDGRWWTPPVECGLLAGVERARLLRTLPQAAERVLTLEDLRHADEIHLANAVRGLRRCNVLFE